MKAIQLQHVTKKFASVQALNQLDLDVEEGAFYGFIGPNGAGKSTTIRILLNILYPTAGSAQIFGLDCMTRSHEIKRITAYTSSDVRLYPKLTIHEIMKIVADFRELGDIRSKLNHYYEIFEMNPDKRISTLSLGNKKKVALVTSLVSASKLLILDEPSNGLDPLMHSRLFSELRRLNESGTTIFLSSHDLKEVQNYCKEAAFIKDGRIVATENIEAERLQNKILSISGPVDEAIFIKIGCTLIEKNDEKPRFLIREHMEDVLRLLAGEKITDFEIKNLELDEKFLSLYEG